MGLIVSFDVNFVDINKSAIANDKNVIAITNNVSVTIMMTNVAYDIVSYLLKSKIIMKVTYLN